MPILPFVQVCVHVLCEHVYVLTELPCFMVKNTKKNKDTDTNKAVEL